MNNHTKEKLRLEQKKKDKHEKMCFYKGIQFSSVFEVEVAKYLDQLSIVWERNELLFPATMPDGKVLHYKPDFYLPEIKDGLYIECKYKFFTKEKRLKTKLAVEQNHMNWIIIFLKDWTVSHRTLRRKIENAHNFRADSI